MLTVVIPTFNSSHCIRDCIGSVADAIGDCHVVVVDNASSDETRSLARRAGDCGPAVEVVEMGWNSGFATASNEGIRRAPGDLILLLNPDAKIERPVEAATLDRLEAGWSGLGSVVFDIGSDPARHVMRERPWWMDVWRKMLLPYKPREIEEPASRFPVGKRWIAGAGLLLRKEEFLSVGGFDQTFFMYVEDRDLCRRYREAGLPVTSETPLHGSHPMGQSSGPSERERPERLAWSFLSWIEYIERKSGPAQAAAAASTLISGSTVLASVAGWIGGASRSARFIRKATQMKACLSYIEGWQCGELPDSDPLASPGFYPAARQALAGPSTDVR